jgi:hypothetical protein
MRTAHSLLRLVSILLDLAQDALQFLLLETRSSAALKAENIFRNLWSGRDESAAQCICTESVIKFRRSRKAQKMNKEGK